MYLALSLPEKAEEVYLKAINSLQILKSEDHFKIQAGISQVINTRRATGKSGNSVSSKSHKEQGKEEDKEREKKAKSL